MTPEHIHRIDIVEAVAMREAGKLYEEIAEWFGWSVNWAKIQVATHRAERAEALRKAESYELENLRAKQASAARLMRADGFTFAEIAEDLGVSWSHARKLCKGVRL